MNILFLADAVLVDKPGGAQTVAWELARRLAGARHSVTFLVAAHGGSGPGRTNEDGLQVIRYAGAGNALAYWRESRDGMRDLLRKGEVDICHSHFAYSAMGPAAASPRGLPWVRSFHGPWHEEGLVEDRTNAAGRLGLWKARVKFQMRRWIERRDILRSQRVIILSEFSRALVIGLGFPNDRIRLIPGGADVDRFPPKTDMAAVRARLGLPAEAKILLSIRRLAARMGLDNLIEAVAAVRERDPGVLLLIGGKGPFRPELEAAIARFGLQNHVRLLGFIPDDDLAAYYQAADLFVLPTLALEGFGLVTVEALSAGTPVLGTPVGATPEILGLLDTRLLAGGATASALADGIGRFFSGDWRHGLTPERLHRFVRSRFTWDRHAASVASVYEECLLV